MAAPGKLLEWVAGIQCQERGRRGRERERKRQPARASERAQDTASPPDRKRRRRGKRYLLVGLSES